MSRNLDPEFQLAPHGADHHTVTLVREGADRYEVEMTTGEARELARRLLVACDLADEDAQQVGV